MARHIRVACILGEGFEDSEFRVPYDEMKKDGYEVVVIGARARAEITGKRGKERVRSDASIVDVSPEEFDLLFIPGGHSPDHLRADDRFVRFVKAFDGAGKPIAAICHGPQLFLTAGIVKGRTLTAWATVQDDLALAGADVRDEPVVRDRNWITSRKPEDLPAFTRAILEALRNRTSGVEERSAEAGAEL